MPPSNGGLLALLSAPITGVLGGLIAVRYGAFLNRRKDTASTDQSTAAAALAKVQSDSTTVGMWKDLLTATNDQNEELRRQNANLEIERVRQNSKLLELEQAVSRNTEKATAAQTEIAQLRQQVADLSAQLAQRDEEIRRLLAQLTEGGKTP